jgi:hypothetical protein
MSDRPETGRIFGIPYNFERPSVRRMLSSYWEPGEGMLVEKPFGVGYTLNLANWRSWIVLATAGALLYQERKSDLSGGGVGDEGVEVVVEDD